MDQSVVVLARNGGEGLRLHDAASIVRSTERPRQEPRAGALASAGRASLGVRHRPQPWSGSKSQESK